jgi:hypothetical protein
MTPLFDRRGIFAPTFECVVDHDIEHTPLTHHSLENPLQRLATLL